jgi:hypothetical protein
MGGERETASRPRRLSSSRSGVIAAILDHGRPSGDVDAVNDTLEMRLPRRTPSSQALQLDSEIKIAPCPVPEGRTAASSRRAAAVKIAR